MGASPTGGNYRKTHKHVQVRKIFEAKQAQPALRANCRSLTPLAAREAK